MKLKIVTLILSGVAIVAGTIWWSRALAATALRSELAAERVASAELARLQADNARRRAAQPTPEGLTQLRSDHNAVTALRREVEALRASVDTREKVQAAAEARQKTADRIVSTPLLVEAVKPPAPSAANRPPIETRGQRVR